jgi:hypothetical protein
LSANSQQAANSLAMCSILERMRPYSILPKATWGSTRPPPLNPPSSHKLNKGILQPHGEEGRGGGGVNMPSQALGLVMPPAQTGQFPLSYRLLGDGGGGVGGGGLLFIPPSQAPPHQAAAFWYRLNIGTNQINSFNFVDLLCLTDNHFCLALCSLHYTVLNLASLRKICS